MTSRPPGEHLAGECDLPVVRRPSGRVLPVDDLGRLLLFEGFDPDDPVAGTWWFTVGGGVEPGEDVHDCAVRELAEETGIVLRSLGEPVFRLRHEFHIFGSHVVSDDTFYLARVPAQQVRPRLLTDLERRTIVTHRWWPLDEVPSGASGLLPLALAEALPALVGGAGAGRPGA